MEVKHLDEFVGVMIQRVGLGTVVELNTTTDSHDGKIAPDYCPVTGAVLDYGIGNHQITDNSYFRPGIDHILAVGNGGVKFGDITNIQIVSQHYNTIKNFGSEIEAIKWVAFELSQNT